MTHVKSELGVQKVIMEFGGQYLFHATRACVWDALNNTEILKAAIPGCDRIDWVSEKALEAEISVDLGVVKPTFTGDLTLSDVIDAERYTLSGRGRGGLLGRVQADANITLQDRDEKCILTFSAEGGASKTLMNLGRPLIGASAQRIIDRFFERIGDAMPCTVEPITK